VGIGLGLVAGLVRIEMRKLADQRRKLLKEHVALLEEVKKRKNLDGYEYEYYLKRLDSLKEPMKDRCISMILTVFDSTINTFYYFISITSLSLLETAEGVVCSIPLSFAFMLNTCIIYSVMNVITSINTEYYEQQRLIVAKEKVKLALVGNKCIANITRYIEDMQGEQGSQHRAYYLKKIRENVQEFKKERHLLQKKMTQPWLAAILTGLNEGLYIYNGVSAFMFTTITILNIFSAGIPAMLLLSGIGIGLGITLIGMLKGALYRHIHVMHQELVENALEKRHFRKLSDATPVLTEEAIAFLKKNQNW
jgi:hypothetical protein